MGEEIDMAIIKRTQDTLGKYIKKPPLTEKLLRKPPFRFLHDILTNVINSTGYMKNLYSSEELNPENVKDKENKIKFLQKAIDVVVFTTGENLTIRPNKVVAGQEADRTNVFLQTLANAIPNKEKGIEAVQRVKKGERVNKSSKKNDSSKKTSQEETTPKTDAKEKSGSRSRSQETVSTRREKSTKDASSKDGKSKSSSKSGNKEKSRSSRISERNENNVKDDNARRRSSHKGDELVENKPLKPESNENQVNEQKQIEENGHMVNGDSNSHPELSLNVPKKVNSEGDTPVVRPSTTRPPSGRTGAMKPSSRPPTGSARRSHAKGSGHIVQMTSAVPSNRPVTSVGRLKTARPSSARPPPPVVRSKRTVVEEPTSPEITSSVTNVIVENDDNDGDDDTAFITEEPVAKLPLDDEAVPSTSAETDLKLDDKQHGSLVSQILETKKDLEMVDDHTTNKRVEIDKSAMSEAAKRKERDLVTREIEKMRSYIQLLTRGVNPLGKMIDYLQEDIDSMQSDLEKWQRENQTHVHSLKQEQSTLETSIEPLKVQLKELDLAIEAQMEKISTVKANILRNEEKIHKLLVTGKH